MLYEFTIEQFGNETIRYEEIKKISFVQKRKNNTIADITYLDDKDKMKTIENVVAMCPAPNVVEFDFRK